MGASHRLIKIVLGAVLGYLVAHYLIDIGPAGLSSGLDTNSWVDDLWDAAGGLFGGGAAGAGGKGKDFRDNASKPPESDPSDPPVIYFPEDGGPPVLDSGDGDGGSPLVPKEDETSYSMFKGLHEFLGELMPDYKPAVDNFLDFSSDKGGLGDTKREGRDD